MYKSVNLIVEVKKRPSLWNPNANRQGIHKHCADQDFQDLQWIEVAKVLYVNWETFSIIDKNDKFLEIKRRWKKIQEYYRNESQSSKGTEFIYKDLLSFLDDAPLVDNSLCNSSKVSTNPTLNNDSMDRNQILPDMSSVSGTSLKKNPQAGQVKSVPFLNKDDYEDEDKAFLLSLLPEFRKLNGREKLDFKISILNGLKKARYDTNYIKIKEEYNS